MRVIRNESLPEWHGLDSFKLFAYDEALFLKAEYRQLGDAGSPGHQISGFGLYVRGMLATFYPIRDAYSTADNENQFFEIVNKINKEVRDGSL